jgi:hypothetical protein
MGGGLLGLKLVVGLLEGGAGSWLGNIFGGKWRGGLVVASYLRNGFSSGFNSDLYSCLKNAHFDFPGSFYLTN